MKSKTNKIFLIVILLWVIITILRCIFHQPWYDEAHAWIIAKQLSFLDIIALMKYEGHTFLWYLLIMPFAKADLWYPIPMQILNWIFSFIAILILWKKAPLNPITKTIVTFSYPFLAQLPIIARCYAIGVMFLFMLTALYNDRLKKPLIYSTLITLCANTSVMALYGAVAFGFIFAFDLVKNALEGTVTRKDFRISFVIMALGAVLILWQLVGANSGIVMTADMFVNHFTQYLFGSNYIFNLINAIGLILTLIIVPVVIFSNKRVFFFYCFTFFSLITTFIFKYSGYAHHYIFFWIYFLITVWLYNEQCFNKNKKITEIAILILFFGQMFSIGNNNHVYYHAFSKYIWNELIKIPSMENNRVVLAHWSDIRIEPYSKENINFKFYCTTRQPDSEDSLYLAGLCFIDKNQKMYDISPTWLHKSLSETQDNIYLGILTDKITKDGAVLEDRQYRDIFEPIKIINNSYGIFKITEIKK